MKTTFLLFGIAAVAALIWFVARKKKSDSVVVNTFEYGPFVVRAEARTGRTFNMNYGMVRQTSVYYSILYEGQPLAFPAALQSNTGLPYLWKVYALEGAPSPTLLAGSQSLYLIYLENGKPVVRPLYEQSSDFAVLQFLDGPDGKPEQPVQVFADHSVDQMQQLETLNGGRYALVGGQIVLDVHTLQTHSFKPSHEIYGDYSISPYKGAMACSPDGKSLAFHGHHQYWDDAINGLKDEYALIVFNHVDDTGYVIPFDYFDTRLAVYEDADYDWLQTYFEWVKDESGLDRLQLRQLDKRPPWKGRYKESEHYYHLYSVEPGMLPVFLDFVLQQMNWTRENILKDETHEYTGRVIELGESGDPLLNIVHSEEARSISFSKHLYRPANQADFALVKKISEAFDRELGEGKYQEYFARGAR
jgi:hypothetical protein